MSIVRLGRMLPVAGAAILGAALLPTTSAAVTQHNCGAPIRSIVKTDTPNFTTSVQSFVNIPGAFANVNVPAGQTRCVKVRFSAVLRCLGAAAQDRCVVRVVEGGQAFSPSPTSGVDFLDESSELSAHSFEWVRTLGAGTHTVRVQAAVFSSTTTMDIQVYTMHLEVTR